MTHNGNTDLTKNNSNKASAYERVTAQIVEQLEAGITPWRKPWASAWPMNAVTQRRYGGGNAFVLACRGFRSAYWLTYRQAKKLGGSVMQGQKGTAVLFYGQGKKQEAEAPESDDKANTYRFAKVYTLFNLEQCEGLEDLQEPSREFEPLEGAERVVRSYLDNAGPRLLGAGGDMACYSPRADAIQLPPRHKFKSAEAYYAVMFHEMGHSTGHASRLSREAITRAELTFGDHRYSEEELVAELTAAFLCADTGISPEPMDNHAAYIASWLQKLQDDRRLLWRAASAAQKAAGWIHDPAGSKRTADVAELERLRAENRMLKVAVNG